MKKRSSRKFVPEKFENPIDNFFLKIAKRVSPLFHSLGMGPNAIITLSFLLVFPLIYFYQIYNNIAAILFLLILYLFEAVEEYNAKTYNLETDAVDYYDHFKDIVTFFVIDIFIFMRLYYETTTQKFTILLVVTFVLFFLMQAHLKNHQEYFKHAHKSRAKKSLFVTISDKVPLKIIPNINIKLSRWFGVGTFVLWNCILILYSNMIT